MANAAPREVDVRAAMQRLAGNAYELHFCLLAQVQGDTCAASGKLARDADLADVAQALAEREAAIRWALGEGDDFPPRPGAGAYWWRAELRWRAKLPPPERPDGR